MCSVIKLLCAHIYIDYYLIFAIRIILMLLGGDIDVLKAKSTYRKGYSNLAELPFFWFGITNRMS